MVLPKNISLRAVCKYTKPYELKIALVSLRIVLLSHRDFFSLRNLPPPKQNHLTLMSLAHESFIFSGSLHGDSALKMSAKRYTYALSDRNTHGLTLIFAHGIGSRRFQLNLLQLRALIVYYPVIDKEHWEPVLQHIFQLQNSKGESYRIREAWSFDWQNHGDSAVLNYAALKAQKPGVCKFFKSYHFTVH